MQELLKNPIKIKPRSLRKNKAQYLGFQTVVGQEEFPIAIFKFNETDAYCWDWLRNGPCVLLMYADFVTGQVGSFGKYEESHISYHESGMHHSRVTDRARKLRMTPAQRTPVRQIQGWVNIASVSAPLTSPLPWKMEIRDWKKPMKKITLDVDGLKPHTDIYLRAYLCERAAVPVLAKRFGLKSWVLGRGRTRLVIAAEPINS
jgi:hypothetical protein